MPHQHYTAPSDDDDGSDLPTMPRTKVRVAEENERVLARLLGEPGQHALTNFLCGLEVDQLRELGPLVEEVRGAREEVDLLEGDLKLEEYLKYAESA